MILAVIVLAPWLFMPFFLTWLVKRFKMKRKLSYLLSALFVPIWPLILTFYGAFGDDGFVLVGTSVLAIPAALTFQKLANNYFLQDYTAK